MQIGSEHASTHILADGRVPRIFYDANNLDVGRNIAGARTEVMSQRFLRPAKIAARETLVYNSNFVGSNAIGLLYVPTGE